MFAPDNYTETDALIYELQQGIEIYRGQLVTLFERVSGCEVSEFDSEQVNYLADMIEGQMDADEGAITNLKELLSQQRESLDAFRELVEAQTQTMNELNEKCKELAEDNADLVKHLKNLVDESIYLAQFKNDTLRGNIRSTDLDEPEWHDYQTIGEAGAFLEKLKVNT
jgi:chromosome segregation ATPase